MADLKSDRRKFLKYLGLSTTATLTANSALASFVDHSEILKLTPIQHDFMLRYGKWMDEFVEVIKIQKTDPENMEIHQKMMEITEKVKVLQPELLELMKDKTFSIIYQASIKRVTAEI